MKVGMRRVRFSALIWWWQFHFSRIANAPDFRAPDHSFDRSQGSDATGDCCSKCWASVKPKNFSATSKGVSGGEPEKATETVTAAEPSSGKAETHSKDVMEPSASSAEGHTKMSSPEKAVDPLTVDTPSPAKKKKKKASYKSMMAGMLGGNLASRDIEKEKEKLIEVTGGGAFQKIDKI